MSESPSQDDGIKLPAVFMFQPVDYEVVTGERLGEWESYLMNSVGLGGVTDDVRLKFGSTPTVSRCGDPPQVDECDEF